MSKTRRAYRREYDEFGGLAHLVRQSSSAGFFSSSRLRTSPNYGLGLLGDRRKYDVNFVMRLDARLKERFSEACKVLGMSKSRAIREMIIGLVNEVLGECPSSAQRL